MNPVKKKTLNIVQAITEKNETYRQKLPYIKPDRYLRKKIEGAFTSRELDVRTDLAKTWKEKDMWPVDIALQVSNEKDVSLHAKYFTSHRHTSRFDPPRTQKELCSPAYAYFAGVAAGDGGFNGGPTVWSVVDGGRNKEEVDYARRFITKIKQLIHNLFGIPCSSFSQFKTGNKIYLCVSNKWFGKFIQHFFNLPPSYKKGELCTPDLFSAKETLAAYWRGVFDTDGSIAKKSYRVSVSSATKSFLETCKEDLIRLGITETNIDIRKPGSYLLHISSDNFERFATTIGFSHPRKKESLLEKLERGARPYRYSGLNKSHIFSGYYDITHVDRLRVKGMGFLLKEKREEKELHQSEFGEMLNVSKAQIYTWENDTYAAPLTVFQTLTNSKRQLFRLLEQHQPEFKVGVRGKESSLVHLPLRHLPDIDSIASQSVATGSEMRIRRRNEDLAQRVEKIFDTTVQRKSDRICVRNFTILAFFKTFYQYDPLFPAYPAEKLEKLSNSLDIPI